MKKKILIIYDIPNYCFHRISTYIQKYSQYDITIERMSKLWKLNINKFDLIFSLIDYRPDSNKILDKKKLLIGIRSDVLIAKQKGFYNDKKLVEDLALGYICSNKIIFNKFKELGYKCWLAEGGIDTEIYKPLEADIVHNPIIVGWAGSRKHFKEFRGFEIIEKACRVVNIIWNPAYKEDRKLDEIGMVKYYQNEIDIFIDIDIRAGRQNGLLESASCGKWIISSRGCGIAENLVENGYNGLLVNRSVRGISRGIREIVNHPEYKIKARETVLRDWTWERHVEKFDKVFAEVLQ